VLVKVALYRGGESRVQQCGDVDLRHARLHGADEVGVGHTGGPTVAVSLFGAVTSH
jgi:hypothetical protein